MTILQVFDNEFNFLRKFDTECKRPKGLAQDAAGNIFVTDSNGVHVFRPDGTFVTAFGKKKNRMAVSACAGICIDRHGRILVGGCNSALEVFAFVDRDVTSTSSATTTEL